MYIEDFVYGAWWRGGYLHSLLMVLVGTENVHNSNWQFQMAYIDTAKSIE